jgi:toxin ParE1/3/4
MRLILSAEVKAELRELYFYTADNWGVAQAKKYRRLFSDAFQLLREHPKLGRAYTELPGNYRLYPAGSHIIVYRTDSKTLHILAVIHMSMEVETRLTLLMEKKRT